ncbi:MAG: cupin domain-containing protein [Candidatus Latescibacterota bacterium]
MYRVLFLAALMLTSSGLFAQDTRLTPSYDERLNYIRDFPGVDLDVQPYVNTWKDSPLHAGHGGFAEQEIFTPGDPVNPPRKGAVLKYLKAFNHAFLYGGQKTTLLRNDREQMIFYIMDGSGLVEAGGMAREITEGCGIFIPAGLEYRFINNTGKPLEAIIIVEGIPAGFKPSRSMTVRNYRDAMPGFCCWAYTTYSLFSKNDGLAEPMGIAVVAVEKYGMGSPHFHVEGCEEIWLKVKGEENPLLLGKKLLRQNIGEAFYPPPNGLIPHAVINPTETPMYWLYIGNRHDKP